MIDPNVLFHKMSEAGQDWADKDAAANLLEETRKSVLAQAMADISMISSYSSRAALEDAALCASRYTDHIKAMVEARKQANRARAHYDSVRTYVELVRTVESTRRAEMQIR